MHIEHSSFQPLILLIGWVVFVTLAVPATWLLIRRRHGGSADANLMIANVNLAAAIATMLALLAFRVLQG